MARPWARATVIRPAPATPSPTDPAATIEPAPMKIRVNVPTTSAKSRWVIGRSIRSLPPVVEVTGTGARRGCQAGSSKVLREPMVWVGHSPLRPAPEGGKIGGPDVRAFGPGHGGGVTRAHPAATLRGDGTLELSGRVAQRESARLTRERP